MAINLRGVGESVKTNVVLTLVELSGLLIVIVIGFYAISGGDADFCRVMAFDTPDDKNVFLAVTAATSLAFFAMVGFEDSVNMAEECTIPPGSSPHDAHRPRHHRPDLHAGLDLRGRARPGRRRSPRATRHSSRSSKAGAPDFPMDKILPFISMFAVANSALINMMMASRLLYGMSQAGRHPALLVQGPRRRPHAVGGDPVHHGAGASA